MKNKIITYAFVILISVFSLLTVLSPDTDISFSERRPLYSLEDLKTGEDFSNDFEKYALDQFILRDWFRRLKAFAEYNIFQKKDNNSLYSVDGMIIKMLYPLDIGSVNGFADKINSIYDLYVDENRVFYSLIPDKNYFADNQKYLSIDYKEMESLLTGDVNENMTYINLFNSLTLDDYYRTDHHYRMDRLENLLGYLGNGMGINLEIDMSNFEKATHYPFYGAYYGQAAMDIDADTLVYLKNNLLSQCKVTIWENFDSYVETTGVYDYEKLGGVDSYDIFLYGTKPIVTIENKQSANNRELIIFKDSFTNSLAPLMIEFYSKITLIDLRLVNHTVLESFVDFQGADILFLYSTMVANNSAILK